MTDPLVRMADDRARARAANDPMAALCVLATVDSNGQPQARTLVLRDLGNRLALFMSTTSPKFTQLASGRASICVYLPSIQVQYRASVELEPVERALIRESWELRPRMPKVLDWFYTTTQVQSTPAFSRESLKATLDQLSLPDPLVAPETAHGFYLQPVEVERLDLAQADGLHDRLCWRRVGDAWERTILVP